MYLWVVTAAVLLPPLIMGIFVDYDINSDGTLKLTSRKQKSSFSNLKEEKLFMRCDLGEFIPTTQFGK